jgi:hypothetical protein
LGLINLLIKHKYGNYGLLTYVELELVLSVGMVLSYNMFYPTTRTISDYAQQFTFNFILSVITLILVVLVIKNIAFGTGQDFFDGTIITFLQMKGRKKVFLSLYVTDVIIPGVIFILTTMTTFYLASFNVSLTWIPEYLSIYLFLSSASYIVTILTKRPFRAFFISIVILLLFVGVDFSQNFMLIYCYLTMMILSIILLIASYYLFRGVSI